MTAPCERCGEAHGAPRVVARFEDVRARLVAVVCYGDAAPLPAYWSTRALFPPVDFGCRQCVHNAHMRCHGECACRARGHKRPRSRKEAG